MTVIEKLENNVAEVNSAFQNIKSKIASHGVEVADELRPSEYAPKVDAVYEAGKKAEYDAFWDIIQAKGNRTNYQYGFAGRSWNIDIFKPKYDIHPSRCDYIFASTDNLGYIDLVEHFGTLGITFDTSNSSTLNYAFSYARFVRVGVIDASKCTILEAPFQYSRMQTIEKLILKDDGTVRFSYPFRECTLLENITIEGKIGQNGFDTHWSVNLSKASITSIINALSATTSGLTVTLSKTAVNNAFETAEGAGDGSTSAEWQSLIASKSNWTINLV